MDKHTKACKVNLGALELLTQIAASLFVTDDPLSQAYEIVRQTAKIQEADISTLFIVEDHTRLILKAGVAYLRGREMSLPKDTHFYKINWETQGKCDMAGHGLTAFIAASGQSLNIESYKDLIAHPCHTGKWDKEIYPDGVDDLKTGFGCLYAVPLRLSKGSPRDTVIGVFKIERRRNRLPFSEEDCKIFDLVAAHLSLILQTFSRVQYRVFSDVAHAIGGGLGRAYFLLTICETLLEHGKSDPLNVLNLIAENLHGSTKIMNRACKRLNLVLEASRDPDRMTEKTIDELWDAVVDEVEVKTDVKIDSTKVIFNIHSPLTKNTKLKMRSIVYHDLITIMGSLVDNAVRYAADQVPSASGHLHQIPAAVYIMS